MSLVTTTWEVTKVTESTRKSTTLDKKKLLSKHTFPLNQHIPTQPVDLNISVFKRKTKTSYWSKIRKKAPKVPDITCPAIDQILNKLEKLIGKELSQAQFKTMERKLERLRTANEQLRDSGKYWHDACKETVRDLLGKKRMR